MYKFSFPLLQKKIARDALRNSKGPNFVWLCLRTGTVIHIDIVEKWTRPYSYILNSIYQTTEKHKSQSRETKTHKKTKVHPRSTMIDNVKEYAPL